MGNALLKLCCNTPARATAAWAAGGAPVGGEWAVHGGRLGKVDIVALDGSDLAITYADDGECSGIVEIADVAAASPAQVAEGEAMLDALGAGPSSPLGRPPLPLSPRARSGSDDRMAMGIPYGYLPARLLRNPPRRAQGVHATHRQELRPGYMRQD
jgi:hypothetical protein